MSKSLNQELVVYFAHGKESGPWGVKIKALAEVAKSRGFGVESPDYQFTQEPQLRIDHLLSLKPQAEKALVLVGSSMGGYVSVMAQPKIAQVDALFLMAPALYLPGYPGEPEPSCRRCCVVHGVRDSIVPVDNAVRFARKSQAELHLLDSEHPLNDQIPVLEFLFARLLDQVLDSVGREL